MTETTPPRDVLVTPDAVVLDLETVGVGTRSLALLVDLLVMFAGFFLLTIGAGTALGGSGDGGITAAAVIMLLLVLPIGYPMVMEATWNGRTLGKAALGLRVVTANGGRIGWRHAAMRAVIGLFELWVTMGAVAFIAALVSERGQRLGDMAAGTLVIRARTGHRPVAPLEVRGDPRLAALSASVGSGRLTADEYGVVRGLVERFGELEPARRRQLSIRLAERLRHRLGTPPSGTAPEDWLAAAVVAHQQATVANLPPPTMPPPAVPPPGSPPPAVPPPGPPPPT